MYLKLLQNVHNRVCPDAETLTESQRRNRRYPTAQEMYHILQHYKANGPIARGHSAAEQAAWTEELIEVAPLTERQLVIRGKGWKVNHKFVITTKGKAYLFWLEHILHIPHVKREDLRQYERRFATECRWFAALMTVPRAPVTEAAPDRLSDDPVTPAPPVFAELPF